MVDEADRHRTPDPQRLEDDGGWVGQFLHGARADDPVEEPVGERAHEGLHVALVGGDAAAHAAEDLVKIQIHALAAHLLGLLQVIEQHAAAAAEVEHAAAGLDPVADDLHVDGAFLDELVHDGRGEPRKLRTRE